MKEKRFKHNGTTYNRCKKCGVCVAWGEMKEHKTRCNPEEIKNLNRIMKQSVNIVNNTISKF